MTEWLRNPLVRQPNRSAGRRGERHNGLGCYVRGREADLAYFVKGGWKHYTLLNDMVICEAPLRKRVFGRPDQLLAI